MNQPGDFAEIVGVRFAPRGRLGWYRAGGVPAEVRSWVVAERAGTEQVGQVIVGQGQCLSFPDDPGRLPTLLREARPDEIPRQPETAGKRLLDTLP